MGFLVWLEQTAFSVWLREAPTLWAFPFVLFLHTVGLGVAAGFGVVINVWLLRFAKRYPGAPVAHAFTVALAGFTLALGSGVVLLIAYPTKALTDWVFYLKLALIVAALAQLQLLRRRAFDPALRPSAVIALVSWIGAVVTGRFLAYTYEYLTAADMLAGN